MSPLVIPAAKHKSDTLTLIYYIFNCDNITHAKETNDCCYALVLKEQISNNFLRGYEMVKQSL